MFAFVYTLVYFLPTPLACYLVDFMLRLFTNCLTVSSAGFPADAINRLRPFRGEDPTHGNVAARRHPTVISGFLTASLEREPGQLGTYR